MTAVVLTEICSGSSVLYKDQKENGMKKNYIVLKMPLLKYLNFLISVCFYKATIRHSDTFRYGCLDYTFRFIKFKLFYINFIFQPNR